MVDVVIPVVVILGLVVLNGMFVAAEFAIVAVTHVEIERSMRRGNRMAHLVRWILDDVRRQDRFIATSQLGITVASLGLGMYGEHIVANWIAGLLDGWGVGRWIAAHTVATILSVTILTYLHIVIGEMVPKTLALQRARNTAFAIAPIIRGVQFVAYPLVIALNGIGNALLRVAGIERSARSAEHFRTPEELAFIVRESQAGGLLRADAANVLSELLELGDRTAEEVMVPRVRVAGIAAGSPDEAIAELFRRAPHARYPVYDGDIDHIIGVVHVKDLLRNHMHRDRLSRARIRPVAFLPQNASVDDILAAMRRTRSQLVIVMDEHGGTAGIVTLEDLFEEVVGEYTDDVAEPPEIYADAHGRLHARGTVRLEEVAEALGVVLEFNDADTLSGVVLALLKRPPNVGDRVVLEEAAFEVTATYGRGVDECIVYRIPPAEN